MKAIRRTLVSVVRRTCRRFGFDVVRFAPADEAFPSSRIDVLRNRWLQEAGITALLDVGANVGQYASGVRRHGYKGRIVSFEPLHGPFEQLTAAAKSDPLWECENLALGEAETILEMNVAGNSECSSFLPMHDRHVSSLPESAYVCREQVRVATIDSLTPRLINSQDVIWLKLDVQGYEMNVLQGATSTLNRVRMLEIELSLVPLYHGHILIAEAITRLAELGFQLVSVEEVFADPVKGHTLQLSGIFESQATERFATAEVTQGANSHNRQTVSGLPTG